MKMAFSQRAVFCKPDKRKKGGVLPGAAFTALLIIFITANSASAFRKTPVTSLQARGVAQAKKLSSRVTTCSRSPIAQTSSTFKCMYTPAVAFHRGNRNSVPDAGALWAATRRSFVGGNWKCNGTNEKVEEIVKLLNSAPTEIEEVDVVVAPPSLYICKVRDAIRRPVEVAAQDSSTQQAYGAFTGETSPRMLKEANIPWVILGHSERRAGFNGAQPAETNELVAAKVLAAINEGLKVILCVGETLQQRETGQTQSVINAQLEAVKRSFATEEDWNSVVIAYEPVWAIGTGRTATPEIAQDTHRDIREWIKSNISADIAAKIRIIYGGSVKGNNAKELFAGGDIDGFLVGGASLTEDFTAIIKATATSPKA